MEQRTIQKTFYELKHSDSEGFAFFGCGGNLSQWIRGIKKVLKEKEIIEDFDYCFEEIFFLKTTGGRTDLVFTFRKGSKIPIGKLAIWRLQFGDCSWISDYIVNYANQHDQSPPSPSPSLQRESTPPTLPLDLSEDSPVVEKTKRRKTTKQSSSPPPLRRSERIKNKNL